MKLLLAGPGTGKTTRIKELINGQQDLDKILVVSFTNATIQDLLRSFSNAGIGITEKNCITLHKYALKINHQKSLHILNGIETEILESYAKKFSVTFDDLCKTLGCITFEQMITQTTAFMKTNPAYLQDLIGDIDLLIVDEFQDFNPTERELISSLSVHAKDSIILGDDDQCIYEFKDADTEGIINLFNDTAVENLIHHNICYRCPDCVVDACSNLININQKRVLKEWKKSGKVGEVLFKQLRTQNESANFVVQEIEKIKSSSPEASVMILSAVEFAVEEILVALKNKNITYTSLWNQKIDFEKIKRVWEIRTVLGSKKILNLLFLVHANIKANKKVLKNISGLLGKDLNFETVLDLLEKSNFIDPAIATLIKNKPSLADMMGLEQYSFLSQYLSEVTLEEDLEKLAKVISEPPPFDSTGINIMSIHKSKGLQADHVFMVGMVEGIIPNALRGLDTVEAQRRLLFVGMSRTKNKLFLLSTIEWDGKYVNRVDKKQFRFDFKSRKYQGRTSAFITELNLS
jgi:DNA helicase-2/ATP-dependent DNA helicase PcrA